MLASLMARIRCNALRALTETRTAALFAAIAIVVPAFAGAAPRERRVAPPPRVAPEIRVAPSAPPRIIGGGLRPSTTPEPSRQSPLITDAPGAVGRTAVGPQLLDSYPREGDTHVATTAELYFVFDQPTKMRGTFSVADLDSVNPFTGNFVLLNLDTPRWSALGDTVFLRPTSPMELGHEHGMKVNTIIGFGAGADSISADLRTIFFKTFPRALLVGVDLPTSLTLVPGIPTPVGASVHELAGNAVTLTEARIQMWTDPAALTGTPPPPDLDVTVPVFAQVPRRGVARLSAPVTVPRDLARLAPDGRLALSILYSGVDETGLPVLFSAFAGNIIAAALTPPIAGNATVRSAVLEWPLPGAVFGAGDTLRPRAVVVGDGTGPFRSIFYLDGEAVAFEEGFMESGRPAVVETRGPIATRRFGEHRLQFVVESPQNVASQPVTFLSAPPATGLSPRGPGKAPIPADSIPPPPPRLTLESTWLADGRSQFRAEEKSVTGWAAWHGRYALSATRSLEGRITSRVRFDDVENGSARPEQLLVTYASPRSTVTWGDAAPSLAAGAPLLASAVPRRGAQAVLSHPRLGTLEAYTAIESHPTSAAGPLREIRSDLYAGRVTRAFLSDRLRASLYGGYTHEDPTPGGLETATRSRGIYGGSATLLFARQWTLLADLASVRHRAIPGVEPGRTRTGARGDLSGSAARFAAHAEAFRYQPDLATALNPYAVSDRKGFAVDLARPVLRWSAFAGYRRESPEDVSTVPEVTVERITAGAAFSLNQDSWVKPSLVRIRQKGPQTDFTQLRLATEFTTSEQMGGRTTARFDAGTFEDEKGLNTRRRVFAGSVVSARRHPGRITSTISAGVERDENRDLGARDMTIQGSLEARWEASPSRFLVSPFVSYVSRDYELQGTREDRLGGRLQFSLLRIPGLGDAALSVQGRLERIWHRIPQGTHDTEGAVELSLGKRISVLP